MKDRRRERGGERERRGERERETGRGVDADLLQLLSLIPANQKHQQELLASTQTHTLFSVTSRDRM